MVKIIIAIILEIISFTTFGQTTIKGKVISSTGEPIAYASIALKGSFQGTSSNINGEFNFSTNVKGEKIIAATCIGYQQCEKTIVLNGSTINVDFTLNPADSKIEEVTVYAGAFVASDEKKKVNMKSSDIGTTASALGDISAAIETLPGSQKVGESDGLFVRGGSGDETKVIIDEMVVQNPYFSPVPDVKQRGRFDPFMFSGTTFSSGGYSALYGQALSAVLALKSKGLADSTNTGGGIHLYGSNIFHVQRWKNTSLKSELIYNNLQPYNNLFNINQWIKSPENLNGRIVFRQKTSETGMFKLYTDISKTKLGLEVENTENLDVKLPFSLTNDNVYINATYKEFSKNEQWSIFTGVSYSFNKDDAFMDSINMNEDETLTQAKVIITNSSISKIIFKFGGELNDLGINGILGNNKGTIKEQLYADFVESDWQVLPKISVRLGLRHEHSNFLNENNLAPRVSINYSMSKKNMISFAYGDFYQSPNKKYLYYSDNKFKSENSKHYILNYQWIDSKRNFRIEFYDKEYSNLVKDVESSSNQFNSSGNGYARGFDIFWRDQKTIPNVDYWVSYTYLDTKRNYQDFPIAATPNFASTHNLSIVYKHWVALIGSMVGFSYQYSSGRPYYNPEKPSSQFNTDHTKDYKCLDINISKMTNIFKRRTVIYASVHNLLGYNTIFGYRYLPDGITRIPIKPLSSRTFFIGVFISTY
ncbi:MAG: TonB-dependent receptor [Bacteroidales bacterium]|nr:MAG: TonB-dependent receptor [Bacteroidales bacterium]